MEVTTVSHQTLFILCSCLLVVVAIMEAVSPLYFRIDLLNMRIYIFLQRSFKNFSPAIPSWLHYYQLWCQIRLPLTITPENRYLSKNIMLVCKFSLHSCGKLCHRIGLTWRNCISCSLDGHFLPRLESLERQGRAPVTVLLICQSFSWVRKCDRLMHTNTLGFRDD